MVVGLVAGSLAVGGPWQTSSTRPVAAAAVVRDIQAAASSLQGYQANLAITERGLSTLVPERHLAMRVAFRAPGRFRIEVHDQTSYPSNAWTPTNITYIANGLSTYRSDPTGCPGDLPVGVCPPTRTTVTRDTPLDASASLAADLVLPLTTLGTADGVRVLGTGTMLGRPATTLQVSFARAAPLFPFLQLGGDWRPFYPGDRVVLTLDSRSWFPLRSTVYPSTDPARRAWELRFGLPIERPSIAILDVRVTSFDERPPALGEFAIPGGAAETVPLSSLPEAVGYVPVTPTQPGDLRFSSAQVPPRSFAGGPASLLTYARGITYLVIGERRGWRGPGPFGLTDTQGELVALAGGGVAYYEPATPDHGRVLSVHTSATDLYLETNLPRSRLLSVASSLPVRGQTIPRAWAESAVGGELVERVSLRSARHRVAFPIDLPTMLPPGSVLVSVELDSGGGTTGVTLYFGQRAVDLAGGQIRLHIEPATALPPASSAEQQLVALADGTVARWTPSRHRLEWVRDGLYRSLDASGLDLATATWIAGSIASGGASGGVTPAGSA
jgi:outer membrane lipoprotein-sorting protein